MSNAPLKSRFETLFELLDERARHRPSRGYTFLPDNGQPQVACNFRELDRRAKIVAAHLADAIKPGDRVLLTSPPGIEYLAGLFGCFYAGAVAVPAYPPRITRSDARLQRVIANCAPAIALTDDKMLRRMTQSASRFRDLGSLAWIAIDTLDESAADRWIPPKSKRNDLAVLQYTSGSTDEPKGVSLSHGNLLHNLEVIAQAFEIEEAESSVCWLPPYHDMGLVGGLLEVMYVAGNAQLMPPASFIQKPLRWLEAINAQRASISGAPNFAYDLCVSKTTPEQRRHLDLSCWEVAFTGAEVVSAETLDRFAEVFADCGFRREAFYPCYGLAEATLIVSGGRRHSPPIVRSVPASFLAGQDSRLEAPTGRTLKKALVSCGRPLSGQEVQIVNPQTCARCAEGQIGEIWVTGPSVAQGYWGNPEKTAEVFNGALTGEGQTEERYLRTGDLGFMSNGELFVAGRLRDIIILRGRNYYPQDIERVATESHPGLAPASGAAFGIEVDGEQKLILVHEVCRNAAEGNLEEIVAAARHAVAEEFDLQLYDVALIRPSTFPRTSSGKARRFQCRQMYLDGTLELAAKRVRPAQPTTYTTSKPAAETGQDLAGYEEIHRWLTERLAAHLRVPVDQINPSQPFTQYGIDSVTAVMISAELENWSGHPCPPTLLYDTPTIDELAWRLAPGKATVAKPRATAIAPTSGYDPIAIVGIGCRLPGGSDSPESFWNLLRSGRDLVRELPTERRDATPELGGMQAGFLDQVELFDAEFFGIAPQEAAQIDPQHRLVMEVCWEALEHAGIAPRSLAGDKVGVFMGISNCDYARLITRDRRHVGPYFGAGCAMSMAAHRISYHLDFRGPSMSVDTACSSSLVSVHLACQSLQRGECVTAIAGGVNLILSGELNFAFGQAQMLSASQRCKTFDAGADGYVRGEGCAAVVLKRLSDALADGDRVLAVIAASAMNQDGRSNGITAPNGASQEALIREAMRTANVGPQDINYVEAHGTGTSLGDPIEFEAIKSALSSSESNAIPCPIGTVKTNIGHLESAAGIAGLVKVVMCLEHAKLPPHLHLKKINPLIALKGSRFSIATQGIPWSLANGKRRAGISSFGFGGTNVHLIVEESPAPPQSDSPINAQPQVLNLSARTAPALAQLADRFRSHLEKYPAAEMSDVCYSANIGRNHFQHRLAVRGQTADEMRIGLDDFLGNRRNPAVHHGVVGNKPPKVAFLFSGQGSQYVDMGRQLYRTAPDYRHHLERCASVLKTIIDRPLLSLLFPEAADSKLVNETRYTQPALFAVEFALAETLRSWGVEPTYVMGHSLGEYVAACVAGVFTLEEGLNLTAERARLMQQVANQGEVAAVLAPLNVVLEVIAPYQAEVSVAAVNGPQNVVISGAARSMQLAISELEKRGCAIRRLRVSHAVHSPLMDEVLEPFKSFASREVQFQSSRLNLVSNLTGRLVNGEKLGPNYWSRQLRDPVQFAAGIGTLLQEGVDIFVEIGPHSTLIDMGRSCAPTSPVAWLPTMKRGSDDWQSLLTTIAELQTRGVSIDWQQFYHSKRYRRMPLPTYPFQRERHWFDAGTVIEAKAPAYVASQELPVAPLMAAPAVVAPVAVAQASAAPIAAPVVEASAPHALSAPLPDSLYAPAWRPRSRSDVSRPDLAVGEVGSLAQAAKAASASAEPLKTALSLDAYHAIRGEVDRLVEQYALSAMQELGWRPTVGDRVEVARLAVDHGVLPQHERLLRRLLDILAESAWLRRDGATWEVCKALAVVDPQHLSREVSERYPQAAPELRLASRCGENLSGVMRGKVDPIEVLFPDGSAADVEALYQNSPLAQYYNKLLSASIGEFARSIPADRPLRILEIGAGTGGSTTAILAELDPARVEYYFTDVSSSFTAAAQEKFKACKFIDYGVLDVEKPARDQGLAPRQFDVIIAANVVHATRSLRDSVSNMRDLLVPGGLVALLEGTRPQRMLDVIFGLMEGWWRFTDLDLRPEHALLSIDGWRGLLGELGFEGFQALCDGPQSDADQVVLLATQAPRPAAPATMPVSMAVGMRGYWLVLKDKGELADELLGPLRGDGAIPIVIEPGVRYERITQHHFAVRPTEADDFTRMIAALAADNGPPLRGAIHLWLADQHTGATTAAEQLEHSQRLGAGAVLRLLQALGEGTALSANFGLWLVTRGAQQLPGDASATSSLEGATLAGFAKAVAEEYSTIRTTLVDLDRDQAPAVSAAMLHADLRRPDGEDELLYCEGLRYAARLQPSPLASAQASAGAEPLCAAPGAYLVVGSRWHQMLPIARTLAAQGARQVVCMAGQSLPGKVESAASTNGAVGLHILERYKSAAIHALALDPQDADLTERLAALRKQFGAIAGVVFLPGSAPQRSLAKWDADELADSALGGAKMLLPLAEALRGDRLSFFTLLGAHPGWLRMNGGQQAASAMESALFDALARRLRSQGQLALSLRCTPVGDESLDNRWPTVATQSIPYRKEQVTLAEAVVAARAAFRQGAERLAYLPVDWTQYFDASAGLPVSPALAELRAASSANAASLAPSIRQDLLRAQPAEQRRILDEHLRARVSSVLGLRPDKIAIDQPITNLGLDSLMAVQLRNRIASELQVSIPMVAFLQGLTIGQLIDKVLAILAEEADASAEETPSATAASGAPAANGAAEPKASPNVEDLSESELDALLSGLLQE